MWRQFTPLAQALADSFECRWESPSSEMGLVSPDDGGGGGGSDRGSSTADTNADVDDGHDDDRGADDQGDRSADARGRRESGHDDEDDQDDDPLGALGDDEDDDEKDTRPVEERFKKVLKSKRRLERTVKKNAGALTRLKELQSAGVNLDDLVHSHRELVALQKRLEDSPKLRALLEGGDEDTSRDRRGAKGREPVKYPFKTDSESGQFFKKFHEDVTASQADLIDRLDRLEQALQGESTARRSERGAAMAKEWRSAAETAAKAIPEGFRDLFMHTIGLDMRRAQRGEIKASAQQVIDFHLDKLKKKGAIGKATTTRASEAARESIARRNETLPRRPAGNGSSGPAKERRLPRMSDYNRQLKAKFGGA